MRAEPAEALLRPVEVARPGPAVEAVEIEEDIAGETFVRGRRVFQTPTPEQGSPLPNFAPVISIPGVRMLLTQQ